VASAHRLLWLALAAVGRAPQRPLVAGADGIHGVPEICGDPGIGRILQKTRALAALDLPAGFATELKIVALVVDLPRAVGFHVDTAIGRGDELGFG